jgi:hypothetical protein
MEGAVTGYTLLGNEDQFQKIRNNLDDSLRLLSFEELSFEFQSMAAMSDSSFVIPSRRIFKK